MEIPHTMLGGWFPKTSMKAVVFFNHCFLSKKTTDYAYI